jgi:hypothetical protein
MERPATLRDDRRQERDVKIRTLWIVIGMGGIAATAASPGFQATEMRDAPARMQADAPEWMRRGLPGAGHEPLKALIGTWRVHKEIYGTLGRRADAPPLVSDAITTRREWVAGGRYIQDTTEGTIDGAPYWRRGWLGYSNEDRRYEWVTIDALNTTMMIYLGRPGSGPSKAFSMIGRFTDQGVVGPDTVGKSVAQRTAIHIDSEDRHTFELFFTPPGKPEQLADRSVYTRVAR